jgi:hypothetical protein
VNLVGSLSPDVKGCYSVLKLFLQCLFLRSLYLIHDGRVESHVIVARLAVSRRIATNGEQISEAKVFIDIRHHLCSVVQ